MSLIQTRFHSLLSNTNLMCRNTNMTYLSLLLCIKHRFIHSTAIPWCEYTIRAMELINIQIICF